MMSEKCNRAVCENKGLHKHKWNNKLYCSCCVFLIEENIRMFGDPPCFDISRGDVRLLRHKDKRFKGTENDK